MGDDNDPPKNPFIRWKQHVDAHIGVTLNGLLGIPAMVTKNLNLGKEPDDAAAGPDTAGSTAPAASGSLASQPPPPPLGANGTAGPSPDSHSPSADESLDGVDAVQLLEWHKFIYYSPYSPLKLHQQQRLHLLPPPVPNDVPFGSYPYAFTYADAFEDLLRASSGRPLLDLAERAYRNLRFQMRYGGAVEPPYVFFHRMHSQGLLDAYFKRSRAAGGAAGEPAAAADSPNGNVVRAVAALAERDRDLWREQQPEAETAAAAAEAHGRRADVDDGGGGDNDSSEAAMQRRGTPQALPGHQTGAGGSLFDELDRVFRVLGRIIDEDTTAAAGHDGVRPDRKDAGTDSGPSAEDELYTAVRSAYSSAEKSLTTLIRSLSGGFDAVGDRFDQTMAEAALRVNERKRDDGGQGETIQTTEEHVDAFGNRHVKTTVQRLDAEGNEMARETRYTIRSPTPQELAIKDTFGDGDEQAEQAEVAKPEPADNAAKPSGWFWK